MRFRHETRQYNSRALSVSIGLLRLKQTSIKLIFDKTKMTTPPMASYLRSHRLKSGMSQRELSDLIGLIGDHQVSNHERSTAIPSLLVAITYQVIFGVPITELFPGLYETIRLAVEERLSEMENALQDSTAKGRKAQVIARKLEWLWERRNSAAIDFTG